MTVRNSSRNRSVRGLSRYSLASLFSGVGGLDSAFLSLGARPVLLADTNKSARATFSANHGMPVSDRSVADLTRSDIRGVDLILAGPPCQGFSSLGRRDLDDARNDLIVTSARLIAAARPAAFVIENVAGLAWLAGGRYLANVLRVLRAAGLIADSVVINCDRLGLPQRRKRILIVGGRPSVGTGFLARVRDLSTRQLSPTNVEHVLLPPIPPDTMPNHRIREHRANWYAPVIAALGPGQKLCDTRLGASSVHSWDLPLVFGETSVEERSLLLTVSKFRRCTTLRPGEHVGDGRPVHLSVIAGALGWPHRLTQQRANRLVRAGYLAPGTRNTVDLSRKFNGRFKRLAFGRPAPAVVREFAFARNMLHPTEPRALTVRECARLQGFPDDFTFSGALLDQYSQVANAFPPPISRLLGGCLEEAVRSHHSRHPARKRMTNG
jgi:DNA (cytosine-5)-methyltransferase 1